MLTLQRASAGSGKTYTLTKEYIGLLISIEEFQGAPADRRRLRTKAELADSVQHILAVTFTNKATNEMKERIITKLDELAYHSAGDPRLPDYMADFMEAYKATAQQVSEACREVLEQLLYNYSDFNISTIDSFFQNILRTFAYESELPDSYQVIIDDTHLSSFASNTLVDDVARGSADEDEKYWIRKLLERSLVKGSGGWNIFLRQNEGRGESVFRQLSEMATSLEKLENENVRLALEEYRTRGLNLREVHKRINRDLQERGALVFAPLAVAAERVMEEYSAAGDAAALLPYGKKTYDTLRKIADPNADPLGEYKLDGRIKSHLGGKLQAARKRELEYLKSVWEEFKEAYDKRIEFMEGEDMRYWSLIEPSLPHVALTDTLHRRIQEYLTDNGAMKIADTNSMIRRIIGDDDVPFIYERLGNRLNHFLIDEFQDTSRMQWDNFRPLLEESEAHGFGNLIIGDAKQSIYRFRNAEPKLITEIVPRTFGEHIVSKGDSVEENSNWRSRSRIVKFNNFFFRRLTDMLAETYGPGLQELYRNTVQMPRSKDDPSEEPQRGYVEVNFYNADVVEENSAEEDYTPDSNSKVPGVIIRKIGTLVTDLLRRGYRQKEIAILVNTRAAGKEVIGGLMDYNTTLSEDDEVLEFVSEDSLTLDSSGAVNTVIECFRLLQENLENGRTRETEVSDSINWTAVQTNFTFFSARHPELDLHERLTKFFEDGLQDSLIDEMVSQMQAVTLPSLVEAFAESFLTPSQRSLEAPFLAALQDAILDYCEANPTDIGSMLRWWDSKGKNISISSPEDTDAINVMTIHKSKGLEFECVILPDIDLRLDMRSEMMWVPVPKSLGYAGLLPDMLPISLTPGKAAGTEWESYVQEERYQVTADNLNKIYVAMTRAVSELYLFMSDPFAKSKDAGRNTENLFDEEAMITPALNSRSASYLRSKAFTLLTGRNEQNSDPEEAAMMPDPAEITNTSDFRQFTYGSPVVNVSKSLEKSRAKHASDSESRSISNYYVCSDRDILKFHPDWQPHVMEEADDDRLDPLSEGSEKHAVLEYVTVEDDLPSALRRMYGRGLLTRRKIRKYQPELQEALESVRDRGWFDGSMKVFNERPMLAKGEPLRRPDRVMVSPEGDAVVIDYKFSTSENFAEKVKAHRRQVGEYMGWLEAMRKFRSVRGYIWYVNKKDIVEVSHAIPFEEQKRGRRKPKK